MKRIGVDTGGTFTDFVQIDEAGQLKIYKQLSTPADPSEAILAGLTALSYPDDSPVVHGSTVATNALLERRGARTALITTVGFEDILAIGRQNRPDIYALVPQKPPTLVPAVWRFGLNERVTADGQILTHLNILELDPILTRLKEAEIESVAVCLLFSFLEPAHEQAIKAKLMTWGGVESISLSTEILPEYREYERTAATVINAYVSPLMGRYLTRLAAGVAPRALTVMQSNGGIISAATAGMEAARTCLSGPAGGVVGARYVAQQAGFEQIITFDMGGTSTDVALCDGRLPTTTEGTIADLPLRLPIIDIHTVGAGGGSLAFVDAGGALHVGPQSAGAAPGPAAYGSGGTQATTTDANLVTGRLDGDHFLGGTMSLDISAATQAVADLARELDVPAERAAWDVLQVANATMERAIRRISVEKGFDPREFTLVPFGGAGPLHACDLAASLQIPRVFIPPIPGVLSALGMLVAAPTKDYSRTVMQPVPAEDLASVSASRRFGEQLLARFAPLVARAQAEMKAEGYAEERLRWRYEVDVRYVGQSHELTVPIGDEVSAIAVTEAFHALHERRYGYQEATRPVEIVTLRLTVSARVEAPVIPAGRPDGRPVAEAVVGRKPVYFASGALVTTLYDREKLQPGHAFGGPAIVFQYDTTIVVPPTWSASVDAYSNLILNQG